MEWLLALLFGAGAASADQTTDYVGPVAAEAAYAAMQVDTNPAPKPKVDTKDCTTCKGTGRVRTGDDQGWTKCPDCEDKSAAQLPRAEVQSSNKFQTTKPLSSPR
jgi:hypothetical protein